MRTFHSTPSTSAALRQVRGADVRGGGAVVAAEQPCLRVQAGGPRLVGDLDLGAQLGEPIEGPLVGGAHVGGRDDADPAASGDQLGDRGLDDAQAVPLDERAEQVDLVGRGHLVADLVADPRLVPAVDQERAGGERCRGADREDWQRRRGGRRGDGVEQTLGVGHLVLGGSGRGSAWRWRRRSGSPCRPAGRACCHRRRRPRSARAARPAMCRARVHARQRGRASGRGPGRGRCAGAASPALGDQVLVDTLFKIPHEGKLAAMNAGRKPVR